VESARLSIGKAASIYTVEDQTGQGPGRTRNRGIEAAIDHDVVIVIDAHMRFDGDALRRLAGHVRKHFALVCPFCHHNAECSFDATTATGAAYYAGGEIRYKDSDQSGKAALVVKWSADKLAGKRSCVVGACYAFHRDWYMDAGQPLAMLPGWGGDEEALSIAAWQMGHDPQVIDAHVAHHWRPRPPWQPTPEELAAVKASRAALVSAFVPDPAERADLHAWQGTRDIDSAEVKRVRNAMYLRSFRTWDDFKAMLTTHNGKVEEMKRKAKQVVQRKPYQQNIVVPMHGVKCVHCATVHDPKRLHVTNTYPNGNRRHICPSCNRPFISHFVATA
jgi:hypothetical protein